MTRRYDVAIIGGGVIGSSVAYHLKTLDPALSVAVIERDPTYRTASSALSASSIRQQFSTPVNIAISRFGIDFLRRANEYLSVDGEMPHLGLTEPGYLYLATDAGVPVLRENNAIQRQAGADIALLEPAALQQRFPWLNTEDLALGSLGLRDEGWFDGYGLLQAFRNKARALGADYITASVSGLDISAGKVEALLLDSGERIACGFAVNAAGPHAAAILGKAGVDFPLAPERHCVFVFTCKETLPACPLVIDTSGVWFRAEGSGFIAGPPPRMSDTPEQQASLEVDYGLYEEVLWPALAHRVPAFEAIKFSNAWAGHYDMNHFDHNAIIGFVPGHGNFLMANGFSGHGMQQSPAAGRGIAELILFGAYRSLDLSELGPERLLNNQPIIEKNII
ncbi:FAD-binding oxidoreductase [Ferrovibrio sp. MS7]|uniref:NAD(P)/FAD-dependent oxidoreductase n=1 Tax=Ferrovibrio plantarum TaxID=3119164 RepID=UPI00313698D3